MKRLLLILFCAAACFGIGSAAFKALGYGDVTEAFEEKVDPNAPQPVVDYVDYPDHNFGVMDVSTNGSVVFRIGNKGNAPLKLEQGPSSCQCTMSNLVDNSILPGEVGEIELKWKTTDVNSRFAQGVTIWTNDKQEPALVLRILGDVRARVGFEPEELVFPHLQPGDTPEREFRVLFFEDEKTRVLATQDQIADWIQSIEPLDADELAESEAASGYKVKVKLPGDLPTGYFVRQIPLVLETATDGQTEGEYEQRTERFQLRGTVRSSATVFGGKIRSDGILRIGPLVNGQPAKTAVRFVLRDADEPIEIQQVESGPEWLHVSVSPEPAERDGEQLYRVDIEIPDDAPVCNYLGDFACPVRIVSNHPRVPVIEFRVEFAVLSPGVKTGIHQ